MIIIVLKLRFLQFFRLLKEIGLFLTMTVSVILSVLFWLGSLTIYNFIVSPKNTVLLLIVIGLLLLSIHVSRKDKQFLKNIIRYPYLIYLSEYFLFAIPFFIIWSLNSNWIVIGALALLVFIIPLTSITLNLRCIGSIFTLLLHPFHSNLNSKFESGLPFISYTSFEWRSGIRRNLFILVPSYIAILALSFIPFVAVFGLIFLSLFISSFYFYGESRAFIELFANNPRGFIFKKITTNFKQISILFAPILFIASLSQTSMCLFLIGAFIVSLLIQVFVIVYKYGLFEENAKLNRHKLFFYLLCSLIVMPHIFFIPVIWGVKSYIKATKNLKQYFNDKN